MEGHTEDEVGAHFSSCSLSGCPGHNSKQSRQAARGKSMRDNLDQLIGTIPCGSLLALRFVLQMWLPNKVLEKLGVSKSGEEELRAKKRRVSLDS